MFNLFPAFGRAQQRPLPSPGRRGGEGQAPQQAEDQAGGVHRRAGGETPEGPPAPPGGRQVEEEDRGGGAGPQGAAD